jgi:hypothetical protein
VNDGERATAYHEAGHAVAHFALGRRIDRAYPGAPIRKMDEDELRKTAHERAVQTAVEQGLPAKVQDPVVIREVLRLLGLVDGKRKEITKLW